MLSLADQSFAAVECNSSLGRSSFGPRTFESRSLMSRSSGCVELEPPSDRRNPSNGRTGSQPTSDYRLFVLIDITGVLRCCHLLAAPRTQSPANCRPRGELPFDAHRSSSSAVELAPTWKGRTQTAVNCIRIEARRPPPKIGLRAAALGE